jgi:hypothetical protein
MERIASQMQRSFIYSGCYTAFGGVSLAQRTAWGLQASSGVLVAGATTPRHLQAPTKSCNRSAAFTVKIKPAEVRVAPRTLTHTRRNRIRCGLIEVNKRSRWQTTMTPERARRLRGARPYRRVCVRVGAQQLTCTIFRGRAFVASAVGIRGCHA